MCAIRRAPRALTATRARIATKAPVIPHAPKSWIARSNPAPNVFRPRTLVGRVSLEPASAWNVCSARSATKVDATTHATSTRSAWGKRNPATSPAHAATLRTPVKVFSVWSATSATRARATTDAQTTATAPLPTFASTDDVPRTPATESTAYSAMSVSKDRASRHAPRTKIVESVSALLTDARLTPATA